MAGIFQPLANLLNRRRRDALLAQAAGWPRITGRLLKSTVVEKDPLAQEGTSFQDRQVECAFYFTLTGHAAGSYFGGHLRSTPLSDSEAHRALKLLPEDTAVEVRYNPENPDQAVALPADNPGFPVTIWPI